MTTNQEVGKRVAELRRPMSQTDLANAMRSRGHVLVQQSVHQIETGVRPLRLVEAESISAILAVPLAALLNGSEPELVESQRQSAVERAKLELVQEFQDFMLGRVGPQVEGSVEEAERVYNAAMKRRMAEEAEALHEQGGRHFADRAKALAIARDIAERNAELLRRLGR